MARIADARLPPVPVSDAQAARRERILVAATELAGTVGFDKVQMHDVARDASVAIGTLYRYFPSKIQLFAAAFRWRLAQLMVESPEGRLAPDPLGAIGESLVALSESVLHNRLLASAFMESAVVESTRFLQIEGGSVEYVLGVGVLHRLGVVEPDDDDLAHARFLSYSWWGVVIAILNNEITMERGAADIRLATRVLLARYVTAAGPVGDRSGRELRA